MSFDIDKILEEYGSSFDFGFTSVDEEEFNAVIEEKEEYIEEYKDRLQQVEKIILPFLTALYKSADQPVIKWPNRGPILKQQIERIVKLTRG